jgi:hypothetical protein
MSSGDLITLIEGEIEHIESQNRSIDQGEWPIMNP